MISHLLNRLYQIIQETVFPPKCLVCAAFFQIPDQSPRGISAKAGPDGQARSLSVPAQLAISLATYLCPNCLAELITVESPLCICCGIPFKGRQGQDHSCGPCIASGKKFGIARAPLVYDRVITEVIHCFKYRGKIQLAMSLERAISGLPVPLHPGRFRRRGFNQTHLLIRNWPGMAAGGFCDLSNIRIERDVLIRKIPTAPQTALDRTQRAINIKNAFDLNREETIVGKRVLLIDDVYTTGATVNECARLLLSRGAQQVDVLTLARAI